MFTNIKNQSEIQKSSIQTQKSKHAKQKNKFSKTENLEPNPNFRIKKVFPSQIKSQAPNLKKLKFEFSNLREAKKKLKNLSGEFKSDSLNSEIFESHFKLGGLGKNRSQLRHSSKSKIFSKRQKGKMTEEQFMKMKNQDVVVVWNNIKDRVLDPRKQILVIEFEGTIGYARRGAKGYLEILHIQHIGLFLKKLSRHFHLVLVYEGNGSSGFFHKIMQLSSDLASYIAVFAVSQPKFGKKTDLLRAKIKAGVARLNKKQKRNSKKILEGGAGSMKMFLDVSEIEKVFPESCKIVFFSAVDKDVFLYRKMKSEGFYFLGSFLEYILETHLSHTS